ncbi:hypothetical protein [Streptomyces vinaceus]|uniref:hypothetical protein n=1 Tax=Streptomyces vinaceus TaxID=1960 RepID=UPI0036A8BAC2
MAGPDTTGSNIVSRNSGLGGVPRRLPEMMPGSPVSFPKVWHIFSFRQPAFAERFVSGEFSGAMPNNCN